MIPYSYVMNVSPVDEGIIAGFDFLGERTRIRVLLEVRNVAWTLDGWDVMWFQFLLQKLFPVQTIEPPVPLYVIHS